MLNHTEEAKYAELRDKCRELRVPAPPEIMIGLKVHDKNGILTFDDLQRGHSWTRNFWNLLLAHMTCIPSSGATHEAGTMMVKGITGSVKGDAINHVNGWFATLWPGVIANASYGIVVGTDNTAFSADQYALGAICEEGTGAGQLTHQAESAVAGAYDSGTDVWTITHARIMNNNSGGSITVKETGIYVWDQNWSTSIMVERSILNPTVTVPNGAQLTVTYNINMDFSAID